ncbi:UDP-N-acetylmuramoylalanine--D-glutamate ligase [Melghiribacillus thermohalophilus]|uniref:UDP-N-acetylmuramoylalanine--D-glutamate ligase n=1 Tax=Melghiribacillus thermohalophilus TaxID=1324956 RepID=A0A4R3ND83_9BACI|nr:UDP-N-acetylmuramoyl-L-alanine--D-glutamate ligase [Melghiribacillus thermohalophilus]TCT26870.1 UDP-N-acetylmuramoylalanine--D-glutamate ligase [Melghiribacillus thermohalophilus]
MNRLQQFPYKEVLVLGLAKSGASAAQLLIDSGIPVRVNDLKSEKENPEAENLRKQGIEVITGHHPLSVLEDVDLVVKNPGIPYENVIVREAERRGIPIVTEVELAGMLIEGPLVGVTGSNGKTTTTTLIYEMILAEGKKAKIAGNIGRAASEVARNMKPDEIMVMELSSFQLLGIKDFRPHVAVLLNIFEAHLDYHKTMEHYMKAKGNIFKNQTANDVLVYNADDQRVLRLIEDARSIKVPFSIETSCNGAWADEEHIYYKQQILMKRNELKLSGSHQLQNSLAAIAAVKSLDISDEAIIRVLRTFRGVKHRLQYVDTIHGRTFYNDSKATNILATSKALAAFQQPVILLAGGLDRGNEFDDLVPSLHRVKAMVLFGQSAPKIERAARKAGIDQIVYVDNVKQAAKQAYSMSEDGDVILLSPACASWDQYRTFEERGDMFIEAVHMLK